MKRILICILLGFITVASGECRAQTEKIDISSDPNFTKSSLSVEELRNKAEAGDISAQFNLGLMYDHGLGVEQDYKEAVKWYRRAAEQGNAEAQYNLGHMYSQGQGVVQDYKEAIKWHRKAAEQGIAEAQYNLGQMYREGQKVEQDYLEAAKWYRKAAEQGFAEAQYNLGVMYFRGEGVNRDYKEAVKWYRRATEQEHAKAQSNLGLVYSQGLGVDQDYIEAFKWYQRAAEQENDAAQFNLGLMYFKGEGVGQDYKEAAKWLRKAAEQGVADAQFGLGYMYYQGQEVKQDYLEAYKWFLLAGMNGIDTSKHKEVLRKKMTADQIAEAFRWSKSFAARKVKGADYKFHDSDHIFTLTFPKKWREASNIDHNYLRKLYRSRFSANQYDEFPMYMFHKSDSRPLKYPYIMIFVAHPGPRCPDEALNDMSLLKKHLRLDISDSSKYDVFDQCKFDPNKYIVWTGFRTKEKNVGWVKCVMALCLMDTGYITIYFYSEEKESNQYNDDFLSIVNSIVINKNHSYKPRHFAANLKASNSSWKNILGKVLVGSIICGLIIIVIIGGLVVFVDILSKKKDQANT